MKKIILDTNFLMIPFQFNLDIFAEIDRIINEKYEICTIDKVILELKKLQESSLKGRDKESAKLALRLIEIKDIKVIKTDKGYADNALFDMSSYDVIIATQDKVLKDRLRIKEVPYIYMRSKNHLEIA